MYVDPPPPKPYDPDEVRRVDVATPSMGSPALLRSNPDYERLVAAWEAVMPHLESLKIVLDKAYTRAMSPQTWDAPVGKRYVEDIRAWRERLLAYRHAVLTAISDEAADTPRWKPLPAGVPGGEPPVRR